LFKKSKDVKITHMNNKKPNNLLGNDLVKNLLTIVLLFVLLASVFAFFNVSEKKPEEITLGKLVSQIRKEKVKKIVVKDDNVEIELDDGTKEKTLKDHNSSLPEQLKVYGISEDQ